MVKTKTNTKCEPDGYLNGEPYWVSQQGMINWFGSYDIANLPEKEFLKRQRLFDLEKRIRGDCSYSPHGRHYMGF